MDNHVRVGAEALESGAPLAPQRLDGVEKLLAGEWLRELGG
jgi:hypothetical protein